MALDYPLLTPYVALGDRGLLKVGMTRDPIRRRIALSGEFKRRGQALVRFEPCAAIEAAYSVERALMNELAQVGKGHSGREWFVNCDFELTVKRAHELTEQWKDHRYHRYHRYDSKAASERNARAMAAKREERKRAIERMATYREGVLRRRRERERRVLGPFELIVASLAGSTHAEKAGA